MSDLPELDAVSRIVMEAAARARLDVLGESLTLTKADGSVVTETDLAIQRDIFAALKARWPHFAVLGEEMKHADQARVMATDPAGIWILDPLDGTTNFAAGFPFYGISLALLAGGTPRLGVVYDPIRNECFQAAAGAGAWLNGRRLHTPAVPDLHACIANVDFKRLVGRLAQRLITSPPYRSQRNLGSAVLEWCWLAAGRFHLYLHGGQNLWDFAAGSVILAEAGGVAMTLAREPIDSRTIAKKSVVAAANRELFEHWYTWVTRNLESRRQAS